MRKDVELFENERAINYDHFVSNWIPGYSFLIRALPDLLTRLVHTSCDQLLVAGCGTGNEILAFKRSGFDGTILGVDPSPDMIRQAREKTSDLSKTELFCGVVDDLPPGKTYDAATLILVMHFLKDNGAKQSLLEQIAARLNPDAPFILVDIFGDKSQMSDQIDVLRNLLPEDIDPEQVEERLLRIQEHIQYIPESRLFELMEVAGFEPPVRFFHSAVYGGWYTRKRAV
ncbi:MAG: class I SAM-dependent methyltransferase [Bacteroidota bacterium]